VIDEVAAQMRQAMKAGDTQRRDALRLVLSALRSAEKDARGELGEDAAAQVLRRERKRRLEAAQAYRDAGAAERAAGEEYEASVIDELLPAELSDDELAAIVDAAVAETGADSPSQLGAVMRVAMAGVAGRADGRRVQALVRDRLGA
jgi:uncharacterized protein YqeY